MGWRFAHTKPFTKTFFSSKHMMFGMVGKSMLRQDLSRCGWIFRTNWYRVIQVTKLVILARAKDAAIQRSPKSISLPTNLRHCIFNLWGVDIPDQVRAKNRFSRSYSLAGLGKNARRCGPERPAGQTRPKFEGPKLTPSGGGCGTRSQPLAWGSARHGLQSSTPPTRRLFNLPWLMPTHRGTRVEILLWRGLLWRGCAGRPAGPVPRPGPPLAG